MTAPEETEAVPLVAAAVEEAPELEPATEELAAEAVPEEGDVTPFAAATMDAVPEPEPEQEPLAAEAAPEEGEAAPDIAAALEETPELELAPAAAEASTEPEADEGTLEAGEALLIVVATEAEPEPEAMPAMAAVAEESPSTPEDKPALGDVAAIQATPELAADRGGHGAGADTTSGHGESSSPRKFGSASQDRPARRDHHPQSLTCRRHLWRTRSTSGVPGGNPGRIHPLDRLGWAIATKRER